MSLSAIEEQIKAILSGVDGMGVVHDYERWAATWEKFLALFSVEDAEGVRRINGWTFSRRKTPETEPTESHNLRTYHFRFRGIYGLKDDDASERVFQQLIEDVCAAFRAAYKLNSTAHHTSPMQVNVVENRVFGKVLCHYAELELTAEEYKTWST